MSPEQKAVATKIFLLAAVAIACITGILLYALRCGHDGVMVASGVAMIAAILGLLTGHTLRDVIGK